MFNINNYRRDSFTITGICKDVYMKNEQGELIDSLFSVSIDYIDSKPFDFVRNTFENTIIDYLNRTLFCVDLTASDLCICGDSVQFWLREDSDGCINKNGDYYSLYVIELLINNTRINEADLIELLPNFEH